MGICLSRRYRDPFNVGPTITSDLANYCGTGGAVCGDSDGKSIASDVYGGVKYSSGAYGEGPTGVFRGTTTRPRTFPPNRFGLYDMHGNVWEYCLDKLTENYDEAPLDGSAHLSGPPTRSGYCAADLGRTTRRSVVPPTGIATSRTTRGWQGPLRSLRVVCAL